MHLPTVPLSGGTSKFAKVNYSLRICYCICWRLMTNFRWIEEKCRKPMNYSPRSLYWHFLPLVYPLHLSSKPHLLLMVQLSSHWLHEAVQLPSGKCLPPILTSQSCCGILTAFPSACLNSMVISWYVWCSVSGFKLHEEVWPGPAWGQARSSGGISRCWLGIWENTEKEAKEATAAAASFSLQSQRERLHCILTRWFCVSHKAHRPFSKSLYAS